RSPKEHYREEYNANRESSHNRRYRDLPSPIQNSYRQGLIEGAVPMYVLNLHRSVVDQHADSQSQTAESHEINRVPGQLQTDDGGEYGKRYGDDHNHHAAPTSQENKNHKRN